MLIPPIQITAEAIMIPRHYMDAEALSVEIVDAYIVIRPKPNSTSQIKRKSWLQNVVGITETNDPTASGRVGEILIAEIDNRSGWTTKPPLRE